MSEIPMLAISGDELAKQPEVGLVAPCPHCGKLYVIGYAKEKVKGKWVVSRMLGFVNCGKNSYLVSLNGKMLPRAKCPPGAAIPRT